MCAVLFLTAGKPDFFPLFPFIFASKIAGGAPDLLMEGSKEHMGNPRAILIELGGCEHRGFCATRVFLKHPFVRRACLGSEYPGLVCRWCLVLSWVALQGCSSKVPSLWPTRLLHAPAPSRCIPILVAALLLEPRRISCLLRRLSCHKPCLNCQEAGATFINGLKLFVCPAKC